MTQVSVDSLGWVAKTPVLISSLHRAQAYAAQQQHRQMTLDHLLLALTEDADALVVLHASNIDVERLRSAVSDIVGRNEDRVTIPDLGGPAASSELVVIFEYASAAADQSGRGMIDGAIVLAALIGEGNSPAARLLETHGLTFEHAIASLQNRVSAPPPPQAPAPSPPPVAPEPVKKTTFESDQQAPANPQAPPPNVPEMRPTPVAAPPVQQAPSNTPQSFGTGVPSQSPPPAPPQPAPRRVVNENTGSPGPASRPSSHVGSGTPASPPARAPVAAPTYAQEDGMIAPWPDPETAAPPQPMPGQPVQRRRQPVNGAPVANGAGRAHPQHANPAAAGAPAQPGVSPNAIVQDGQLIENIPRKMRVGISEQVEVRIARNSVNVPLDNMQGGGAPQAHNLYVTKAMTVRLRAPEGGIRIETSSPETQWIDNALGLIQDDFASWRWTVTPDTRGVKKFQLVVSARTVGADGVAAETALPDQVFDVVVRMNYARTAVRLGGWAVAAAAGGAITAFGEEAYKRVIELANLV